MDDGAIQRVRQHYGRHANNVSSREALRRRQQGPALPLKRFHNLIKERLIQRFCFGAEKVLDLCCGRGGDIRKWDSSEVSYVKGIDLSEEEITEAKRRLSEYVPRQKSDLSMEFESSDILGRGLYKDDRAPYNVVTCFFALHYFMVTEKAIDNLLLNVSKNLRLGGYFICTCPDGKRVISALTQSSDRKKLQTPMLTIVPKWSGSYQCFGTAFTCSITDTVTEGEVDVEGSLEYLVFTTPLKHIGAKFGLKLITNYEDAAMDELFDKEDASLGFKHFRPRFRRSDPSLELASGLNMAFVFQKVTEVKTEENEHTLEEIESFETTLPSRRILPQEGRSIRKRKTLQESEKATESAKQDSKKSKILSAEDDVTSDMDE